MSASAEPLVHISCVFGHTVYFQAALNLRRNRGNSLFFLFLILIRMYVTFENRVFVIFVKVDYASSDLFVLKIVVNSESALTTGVLSSDIKLNTVSIFC